MEAVRAAFSLRWKILAWFFVNLLVLGLILFLFLRVQFRVGVGSLLAGATSDRLEAIARPLAAELRAQPVTQWNTALERALAVWRARGVRAGLFWGDGTPAAGELRQLPSEVLTAMRQHERHRHGPPPGGGHLPGPGGGSDSGGFEHGDPPPEPPDDGFGPGGPPTHGGSSSGNESPDHDPSQRPPWRRSEARETDAASGGDASDKFMLVAGNPRLYWAGVSLGEIHQSGVHRGPPPELSLVLASGTLRGGGLFFDYVPWLVLGGGLVLVSVGMWLPLVGSLTRALAEMTHAAEEVARGRFQPPDVGDRRDELGRLGRALGHMAHRLDGFVTGQKRFLGDTAHELLSPLARLEVALSILEQRATDDGNRLYTERALEEVRQMASLVQSLLSFTKTGLQAQAPALVPVGLAALVHQAVEREAAQAEVAVHVDPALRVLAEPDLLGRALANVIRNAVQHAGGAGPITVGAVPVPDENGVETVRLSVADAGPGVPPEALDRLFDPFFRPESARTRETGGVGLGLAIVRSGVEACGGRVAVRNRQPTGLEVEFTLCRAG